MGTPEPSPKRWRDALAADPRLSHPAVSWADYLSRRPVPGLPGCYRANQARWAESTRLGLRTVSRAHAQLVTLGYLVRVERGIAHRPESVYALCLPNARARC